MRIASADCDRAGVDIAEIDVPAFLAGFSRSASGKGGHGHIKARRRGFRNGR